jgi:hypothetical protein
MNANESCPGALATASPPRRAASWQRLRVDQRGGGYVAAFIVLFSTLIVAGVGILVDTARIVATDRQMYSIALEAARAGANAVDSSSWRFGSGAVVDPGEAQAAASAAAAAFVSASDASLGSVSVNGSEVTVTVSATVDPRFPLMSSRTVSATASAVAVAGITQEGQ